MKKYFNIGILFILVFWTQSLCAQDSIPVNTYYLFEATDYPGYTYSWWYVDASNNKTFFESTSSKTEEYYWSSAGLYDLFVQATDGNNCLTEIISKDFVVLEEQTDLSKLYALPDFIEGVINTTISGDVSTNDFLFPNDGRATIYTYDGETVQGLTFNSDGTFTYNPPQDFYGKVHFSYKWCFTEDQNLCSLVDVEIRVLSDEPSENLKPVASTDVVIMQLNTMVNSSLLSNDANYNSAEISSLTISESPAEQPENGSVTISPDGTFTFTPNSDFVGMDKFRYQICSTTEPYLCDSAWAYVIVDNFEGSNETLPTSIYDDLVVYDEEKEFSLSQNDFTLNSQTLIYNPTPVSGPQNGTLGILEDGSFTYTPNSDFYGIDQFVYEVCDNSSEVFCKQSTAFIIVPEQIDELTVSAGKDTTIGSCNSYILQSSVSGANEVTYSWKPTDSLDDPTSPNPVFTPGVTTTFELTVIDIEGETAVDSVIVTVSEIMADAGEDVGMPENSTAMLDATGSIGESLSYLWSTIEGVIDEGGNTVNPVVSGYGAYFLQITDKYTCAAIDTVNVFEIAPPPMGENDFDTTYFGTELIIDVLANDSIDEGLFDPSSMYIAEQPFYGTAYIDYNDFTIHYRPELGFTGTDIFEYQFCDTFKSCTYANVYVFVNDYSFLIPDAFSPNGDGINDYFEIIGIQRFVENEISIFNRWGNKVYEAVRYGISSTPPFWDGKSNTGFLMGDEDLPSGTYYYVLKLGSGEKPVAGSIYLDR